ncbi:class I SAM-dependent methyltransferase [Metabacillus malikii]|uniref:Ubiquinone/menaquinone biosynthesis C-methylase UbiE n=1 Tax=Metabacillus malikii TaxID=1504265 RepID=A0ABT9ZIF6_9BACI|nr:class I SAM-dependent methyltransferase [Metabacillus malikii]MDQ0232064.1 ubiquinone/menaquinone biosynthesis C-methylase UbiE [Metabacillus malikii]
MAKLNEKEFYEKVGKTNGWDFSKLQVTVEGMRWDFHDEVKKMSKSTDVLLDVGTGGGESLLQLASSFQFLVGIDLSATMIETAQKNVKDSQISNVRFTQMSSDHLLFPEEFFDIVTCRHAPFCSKEIARVLKSGGSFLTQQVGEMDKLNLKQAFKRGHTMHKDGALCSMYVKELYDAGFSEIQTFEYDATDYYHRPEDLIFLLKHTPTIPQFGEKQDDFEILEKFIRENTTSKGIRTNSKRFLIVAKK